MAYLAPPFLVVRPLKPFSSPMPQSHLQKVFAVNITEAVATQNAGKEEELRQLARLLPQKEPLLRYARRALRSPDLRSVLHVIFAVFEVKKEARVVRPVVAWLRHEPDPYLSTCALWCLSHYDCSAYLPFVAQRLAHLSQASEAAYVLVMVLKAMKGPFAAPLVRKALRVLSHAPADPVGEDFLVLQLLRAQAVEICARFYRLAAAEELAVYDARDEEVKEDA